MQKLLAAALIAAASLSACAASATQAWVGQSALNARSGPGTHYHVLGTFHPCTPVHVLGWKHGWAKVAYKHKHYWVSGKYLQTHSCHHRPHYKKHHKKHHGYGY
jgi:uncharacterized protein YraI